MQEILGHLTRPLNDEERKTGEVRREKKRLIGPDTAENIQRYFDDRFWSDQLPIIMPTEERVAEMLKHTRHKPGEIGPMFSSFAWAPRGDLVLRRSG